MRVAGQQHPAPQILQRGMPHDAFHQPLAQAASAMRFEHEHVAKIRDRSEVANHPGKAHLSTTIINAKAERMLDRPRHNFARNSFRPIAVRQEPMNHVQVEADGVGTDQELAAPGLHDHVGMDGLRRLHLHILNRGSRSARLPVVPPEPNKGIALLSSQTGCGKSPIHTRGRLQPCRISTKESTALAAELRPTEVSAQRLKATPRLRRCRHR